MSFAERYRKQVDLLLRVLPFVSKEGCFALKGGTAINLFVRDMPRLSIDIDLTYVPIRSREESLAAIDTSLKNIAAQAREGLFGAHITETRHDGAVIKLVVRHDDVQIKIEVTPVLRGCVLAPELRCVTPNVEDQFGFAEIPVVSFADLYAGKLVAALDRQHPRDLFDVRELLAKEGIGDDLRRVFIVYLLSHDRPMSEVLAPTRKDISQEYARGFVGMTSEDVQLADLVAAREEMIRLLVGEMPEEHKRFLVSFEKGDPEWPLLKLNDPEALPAVRWRQQNLDKLDKTKRALLVARLESVLGTHRASD